MNRSVRTLSALLAVLGLSKIFVPTAMTHLFTLDTVVALAGLLVAVVAVGVWLGPLRFLTGSSVSRIFGFAVLVVGVASISSPTLLGMRATYLPIADIFMIIEAGIVLQLIGLERKIPETLSPWLAISVISQLLWARYGRSLTTTSTTKVRSL